MEYVDDDDAGKRRQAGDRMLSRVRLPDQREGDHRHRDLDADRILADAEEVSQLRLLLDPADEQLDVPAPLVKRRNRAGGRIEVVGQHPQDGARLDLDPDLADGVAHRVAPAVRRPFRQEADPVGRHVGGTGRHRARLGHAQRGVGLKPGDDAAGSPVELRPPAVIIVAEVEDISGARLDRHRLGGGDVVDSGRGDAEVERAVGVGVKDDMALAPWKSAEERGFAAEAVEVHGGRTDQAHAVADTARQLAGQLRDQRGERLGKHRVRAQRQRVR